MLFQGTCYIPDSVSPSLRVEEPKPLTPFSAQIFSPAGSCREGKNLSGLRRARARIINLGLPSTLLIISLVPEILVLSGGKQHHPHGEETRNAPRTTPLQFLREAFSKSHISNRALAPDTNYTNWPHTPRTYDQIPLRIFGNLPILKTLIAQINHNQLLLILCFEAHGPFSLRKRFSLRFTFFLLPGRVISQL